ncbi:MAG: hypothetical protein JNM19_18785 [Chitinophagaceae bacterium]|nr:hypothetical protein [Chitinophagaceae bacterium]
MKKPLPFYKYTHYVNEGKACMIFVPIQAWNIYKKIAGSNPILFCQLPVSESLG